MLFLENGIDWACSHGNTLGVTVYTYNSFLFGLLREREEMRMDAGGCVCMEMEEFSPIKKMLLIHINTDSLVKET